MAKKKEYTECLTTPFETGIRNFTAIAKYFIYYAPNIDSAQSVGRIEGDSAAQLVQLMLDQTGLLHKSKILKKIQPKSWAAFELDQSQVDFEKPCMVVDKYSTETDFHALLRHIRNAFAHGYIYVWRKKKGDFVFLMDYDSKKNKVTAKMMVSMAILEQWKALIENQIAIGE